TSPWTGGADRPQPDPPQSERGSRGGRRQMRSQERGRFVIQAILYYALFSVAWIVLSDRLLIAVPSPSMVALLSTAKGLIFVVISALFLAWAMMRIPDQGVA